MKQLLAINLQVRCADGATHEGVNLFVKDNRRIYVAKDGTVLTGVNCIKQCTSVVPPLVLSMALYACKECE